MMESLEIMSAWYEATLWNNVHCWLAIKSLTHTHTLFNRIGLRLCIHKGTKGMGGASKQLVLSSLWISQETFQKGTKGIGRKVKVIIKWRRELGVELQ